MVHSTLFLRLFLSLIVGASLVGAADRLCSANSKVESKCASGKTDDPFCAPVKLDDYVAANCSQKMFYKPILSSNPNDISDYVIECDRTSGQWKKIKEGAPRTLASGNVYCQFESCDWTKWTSDCGMDDDCAKFQYLKQRLTCEAPYTIWSRHEDEREFKKFDATKLDCWRGKLFANDEEIPEGVEFRCRKEYKFKEEGLTTVHYVLIGVFSTLAFLAIIFWLILRRTGTRWIAVIFGRASKRTAEDKNYDFDAPSRTPNIRSPSSPGVVSPLKAQPQAKQQSAEGETAEAKPAPPPSATIVTSRDRITTEELASKEKISAEKIVFRI